MEEGGGGGEVEGDEVGWEVCGEAGRAVKGAGGVCGCDEITYLGGGSLNVHVGEKLDVDLGGGEDIGGSIGDDGGGASCSSLGVDDGQHESYEGGRGKGGVVLLGGEGLAVKCVRDIGVKACGRGGVEENGCPVDGTLPWLSEDSRELSVEVVELVGGGGVRISMTVWIVQVAAAMGS